MLRRLAPYIVLLFGFAVRMAAIDTTLIDGDRANPHGIGLLLANQIAHGEFSQLLLFSDNSSIGLPNPPLMNYVWAAVSLFDKSLFAAVALGLMANALVIAIVYATGRRCFGWTSGLIAATLVAGSNWATYLASGAWHPSHLEILVVASASLLALGLRSHQPKRVFVGFALTLLAASGYFTGLVVPVQAIIATALAGAGQLRSSVRRAWLAGVGLCLIGVMAYVVALLAAGRLTSTSIAGLSVLRSSTSTAATVDPSARDPIGHFLRLATNRDYAVSWTDAEVADFATREPLSQALAGALSACVVLGLLRMAWNWRQPANRFWLAWAALPVLALLAVVAFKRDFEVALYYLLLTSPVQYLAGGYGLAGVLQFLTHCFRWVARPSKSSRSTIESHYLKTAPSGAPAPRRITGAGAPARAKFSTTESALALVTCGALAVVSTWNTGAAVASIQKQAFIRPDFMPLRWSMQLSQLWQHDCTTLNGSNLWWDLSLFESPDRWRLGGTNSNAVSSIWTFAPGGGACALKQTGEPLPHSELLPLPLDDGKGSVIRTYRALPFALPRQPTMTVNLGWTLLGFDAPLTATAGTTITVQHAWLVNALPSEPHASWYYAPFVKLVAPDGNVVVDMNGAVALPGWQWQAGEVQASDMQIALPADLPPGDYTLQSSLFDPNQKKNAVYFDDARPGEPILTLTRVIRVR